MEFTIIAGLQISAGPRSALKAFSRAVMDEKLLSSAIPVGVWGSVDTNDWCIMVICYNFS